MPESDRGRPPTAATGAPSAPTVPGRGPLTWAVLAGAVLQVLAPVVTVTATGSTPGSGGADLLITPVGWAFAIWGVIYTLALVQAVLVLVRQVPVTRRVAVDQVVLYLAGAVWILVSAAGSSTGTAVVLVVMAVVGVDGALALARGAAPDRLRLLTVLSFGLYAGWVTAAVFLNLGSAAVGLGLTDEADLGWQAVLLVVAAVVLVVVTFGSGGNPAYAAAGAWALFGITVTTSGAGDTALLVLAVVGLLLVVAAAVAGRVRTGGSLTPAR